MIVRLLLLIHLMAFAGTSVAQPYATDLLATTFNSSPPYMGPMLYRIHPNGGWTSIAFFNEIPNMVCMDQNNRDAAVLLFHPPSLITVDTSSGQVVATLWNGNGLLAGEYLAPLHDGSFVVGGTANASTRTGRLLRIHRDGSQTTIYSGSLLWYPQGILQDLHNGHLVVHDFVYKTLFEVTLRGTATTLWSTSSRMDSQSITQDHFDGNIILGCQYVTGTGPSAQLYTVLRWDRGTGKPTTLVHSNQVNYASAICFDRDVGMGAIVTGHGPVYRVSRSGRVVVTIQNLPRVNTGLCFDRGRNVVTRRINRPNHWAIQVDFPRKGGLGYVVGMSMSGFMPGIPVGSRVIPLIPDVLFRLSHNGLLDSFLKGRTGFLDSSGRATATLDLRSFGNRLTGVRIWIAAVALDAKAPNAMAVISKPVILLLD